MLGDEVLILGVPAMVLVPVVVEWLKAVGLPVRWAGVASVVTAGALATLGEAVVEWPRLAPVGRVVLAAILVGMAGSGAYSQARVVGQWRGGDAAEEAVTEGRQGLG